MPVPDFSPGEVLTAAAMDSIGLWKITPTSVSGTGASLSGSNVVVTSGGSNFTVNGAFNSNFRNYKVLISDFRVSAASYIYVALGTSNTGTAHSSVELTLNASTNSSSVGGVTASTRWLLPIVARNTTDSVAGEVTIFTPAIAIETSFTALGVDSAAAGLARWANGWNSANTAFTSLFFSTQTAETFTSCVVQIYGYN
jgi:hypothetical protein